MRERIWDELTQAKHSGEFAALYSDEQRKMIKLFNILVLAFSTGGAMGWKFWDDFPFVACVIISVVSFIKLLQPHLIMSEKQLSTLDQIQTFYCNYYNQLEKLWYEFENGKIDASKTAEKFFKIKDSETEINLKVNDCIRRHPKRLVKKAKLYSDLYFSRVFNTTI